MIFDCTKSMIWQG